MGNKKPKSLEAVLKKPNVPLEEVLDVDSLLIKARSEDPSLIKYLHSPGILHNLLSKIVQSFDTTEKSIRYPFVACELVVLQTAFLAEQLKSSPSYLEVIWTFLQSNAKVDPQRLVYITKILVALLTENSKMMFQVFRERGNVLDLFIKHLENTPAADFLCRIIEMESSTVKVLQWLVEEGFFKKLMQTIDSNHSERDHFALYQFIHGLLMRSFPENYPMVSLLHRFTNPVLMEGFLSLSVDCPQSQSSWIHGIGIISVLCIKIHEIAESASGTTLHLVSELERTILPRITAIVEILDLDAGCYNGPGIKVPRVGVKRIKASRLLADLVLLKSTEVIAELKRLQVSEKLFGLFFTHHQNTFLHTNVVDYFTYLCQGDWAINKDTIVVSIIRKSKLLERIKQCQKIADSFAEMPRKPRPNFMGHVTLLSDQIHNLIDRHGAELYKEIGDLLRNETWIEYSNKSYRETKLKDAFVLGGEQAPLQPVANEDVFASVFTASADETIIRYFCHEIISSFPPSLHLGDIDEMLLSDDDDNDDAVDDAIDEESQGVSPQGILGGTMFGNREAGFENIMTLELELRMSNLDDDEFDLGPDSEDENIFE